MRRQAAALGMWWIMMWEPAMSTDNGKDWEHLTQCIRLSIIVRRSRVYWPNISTNKIIVTLKRDDFVYCPKFPEKILM